MDLSDIGTDDSPPHRKLKVEAGKVLKSVTTTVMGPTGEPVLVEFELRRGPPGAPGMPQELFKDLLHANGAAAAQDTGIGRPMAEAMAAKAADAASPVLRGPGFFVGSPLLAKTTQKSSKQLKRPVPSQSGPKPRPGLLGRLGGDPKTGQVTHVTHVTPSFLVVIK